MTAQSDEKLFWVVLTHVDTFHDDLGYTPEQIRQLIRDEAEDAP
jgi:hypothetical protein